MAKLSDMQFRFMDYLSSRNNRLVLHFTQQEFTSATINSLENSGLIQETTSTIGNRAFEATDSGKSAYAEENRKRYNRLVKAHGEITDGKIPSHTTVEYTLFGERKQSKVMGCVTGAYGYCEYRLENGDIVEQDFLTDIPTEETAPAVVVNETPAPVATVETAQTEETPAESIVLIDSEGVTQYFDLSKPARFEWIERGGEISLFQNGKRISILPVGLDSGKSFDAILPYCNTAKHDALMDYWFADYRPYGWGLYMAMPIDNRWSVVLKNNAGAIVSEIEVNSCTRAVSVAREKNLEQCGFNDPVALPTKETTAACVNCGANSVSNHIYCPECLATWEMDNLLHSWTLIVLCPPDKGAGVIETKLTDISKRQAVVITESLIKQFYAGHVTDDETPDWKQLNFYTEGGYNVATLDLA